MGVQSYLSLYTILLGWQQYDALWVLMAKLGFLALPFAVIAYKSFFGPYLSMGAKDAGLIGARRFVLHSLTALFVLVFAGVPTVRLQPYVLHFTPVCSDGSQTAVPGNTGTTYDDALPVPDDVRVPILWYLVMAISNGITDEAVGTLSCPTTNLRQFQSELNLSTIQDTQLKNETKRFYNECYSPAYRAYLHDDSIDKNAIDKILDNYGSDDVSWMGSQTFQRVDGFYNRLQASKPVEGFPYNAGNVQDEIEGQVGDPQWGSPDCVNWWEDGVYGLRERLYSQFDHSIIQTISMVFRDNTAKDDAIRVLIENGTGGSFINSGFETEEGDKSGVDHFYGKWSSKALTDYYALSAYPKIHIIINALPVIQALLLGAVIMLLAIALPLSGYNVGFCVTATLYLFSIIFCSYLWHWVTWLDQTLMQALYGVADSHTGTTRTILNMATSAINPEKNLLDITISIFYIVLPTVWLTVMGWAGAKVGQTVHGLSNLEYEANSISQEKLSPVPQVRSRLL